MYRTATFEDTHRGRWANCVQNIVKESYFDWGDFGLCTKHWLMKEMSAGVEPKWTSAITPNHCPHQVKVQESTYSEVMFLRPLEWRFLPPLLNDSRDPKEPEVCDHHFIGIVKNILWLQVFVHDSFSVQITHSLYRKTHSDSPWRIGVLIRLVMCMLTFLTIYMLIYMSLLHNSAFLVLSFVIINYSTFSVALDFHAATTHEELDLTDS